MNKTIIESLERADALTAIRRPASTSPVSEPHASTAADLGRMYKRHGRTKKPDG